MSRQRFIYPETFTSEDFTSLTFGARLLFIGLIGTADDYGRGKGSPRCIKASIFPADDCTFADVESWAGELDKREMVIFYTAEGSHYYQIVKWEKYQRPKYKAASKIPQFQGDAGSRDNPGPDPDQTGPRVVIGVGVGVEEKDQKQDQNLRSPRALKPRKTRADPVTDPTFDAFWTAYPRKTGKAAALKAWAKVNGHAPAIMTALAWQVSSADHLKRETQFTPHPATWLNQRRWEDEKPTPSEENHPTVDSWGRPVGYA